MFEFSNEICKEYISKANQIRIYFYNTKDENIEMYDTRFKFNNNIIPLAISIFEIQPNFFKRKIITVLDGELVMNYSNRKGIIGNTSFYFDIDKFVKDKTIIQNKRNIIKTIHYESMLLMFVNEFHTMNIEQIGTKHFNEHQEIVFQWKWNYIIIEFIINNNNFSILMKIEMNEKQNLISSKVEFINDLLKKCNKILYQLKVIDGIE